MDSIGTSSLLTVRDAAGWLRTSEHFVYRRIESGQLSALRLGTGPKARIRIDPADLSDFVQRHADEPAVREAG